MSLFEAVSEDAMRMDWARRMDVNRIWVQHDTVGDWNDDG